MFRLEVAKGGDCRRTKLRHECEQRAMVIAATAVAIQVTKGVGAST